MLDTKITLTVSALALAAAEKLNDALRLLNGADGRYADGNVLAPYGKTQSTLRVVLEHMLADPSDDVTDLDGGPTGQAEVFARFVVGECADNGENVEYQITQVLGWDLVLTGDDPGDSLSNWPNYPARTATGHRGYTHIVPTILGGLA